MVAKRDIQTCMADVLKIEGMADDMPFFERFANICITVNSHCNLHLPVIVDCGYCSAQAEW